MNVDIEKECGYLMLQKRAEYFHEIAENSLKIDKEVRHKLDSGMCLDDITVEMKNQLWKMNEDGVDRLSPEYVALKDTIAAYQEYVAEEFYKTKGWKKKYSGEWVRKEKE